MEAIPEASDEDFKAMPNIIYTFHMWMESTGRNPTTCRTYARQVMTLFEEDWKTAAGMATDEYFWLVKNSAKNKSGNGQRSASVRQFMDFWAVKKNEPMKDHNKSEKPQLYRIKEKVDRPKRDIHQKLDVELTEEGRRLRKDLDLPPESTGWSVMIRTRASGDLVGAVSPGGSIYTTRSAVDQRLKRGKYAPTGSDPPDAPSKADSKPDKASAKAAAKEDAPRPKTAAAAEEKASSKTAAAAEEKAPSKPTASPPEQPAEAKPVQVKKELVEKDEPKKVEVKTEEIKKEVKEEEVKKEEEKDDLPDVKIEPKDEVAAETGTVLDAKLELNEDNGGFKTKEEQEQETLDWLMDMNQDGETNAEEEDKKRRKLKRHHRDAESRLSSSQDPPPADLSTPAVESDTEYPETDVSTCPSKIDIMDSGSHKCDGTYYRMLKASRGKPCYMKSMKSGSKHVYLFFSKKWKLGFDFGAAKSLAHCKDSGLLSPCEPYPHCWKVMDKNERKDLKNSAGDEKNSVYEKKLGMRVVDSSVLHFSDFPEFEIPDEAAAKKSKRHRERATIGDLAASLEPKAESESTPVKAEKPIKAEKVKVEKPDTPAAQQANGKELPPADSADALGPADSDDEDDERGKAAAESSPSESSSCSSSSDSGSDSEEEEVREVKPAVRTPTSLERVQDFEAKTRMKLRAQDAASRGRTLLQMKAFVREKGMKGIDPEHMWAAISRLEKEFGPPVQPKAPAAPPRPAARLAEDRSGVDAYGAAAPTTPDGAPLGGETDWRRQARQPALRSALRKPGEPRKRRRITMMADVASYVQVESYRICGEQLWFIAPGQYVICDKCEKEVSQAMGSLQGSPTQSQFAQSMFVCGECSGGR